MDNESGSRGSRSNEPPKLAPVRRLHLDDGEGSSATATEEWYETERLTGHITGRARGASPGNGTMPSHHEPTPVLDWRHADPAPAPSAAQRLRRSLDRRRGRKVTLRVLRPDGWLRRHGRTVPTGVPESKTSESLTSTTPKAAAHRDDPAQPLLGFRHDPEPQQPKFRRPLGARAREKMPQLAWGRGASIVALTLMAAAAATIGIAAALSDSPAKPRRTAVATSSSGQAPGFTATAKALTAAVGFVEHQIHGSASVHRAFRARRAHRVTPRRSHGAHQRPPNGQSSAPAAAPSPASTASSYGGSSSSPAYSGSTSSGSTSSQSVTSEPAPAATTQRTQPSQPAFGQNGSLGPGRGAPGTQ